MLPESFAMPEAPRRLPSKTNRNGLLLTLPLLAFIAVFFAAPSGAMLWRSVSNPLPASMMPRTVAALSTWDAKGLPDEAAYAAVVDDLKALKREEAAKLGATLNFDYGGLNSLFRKTAREAAKLTAPFADSLVKLDKAWGSQAVWAALKVGTQGITAKNYLAALDQRFGPDLSVQPVPERDAIYLMLFGRTAWVAALVTVLCLILGYPLAWLLANAGPKTAGLLMILLLLPFWTSLLVRTTAWIAILQSEGVVNDILVFLGLVDDRYAGCHDAGAAALHGAAALFGDEDDSAGLPACRFVDGREAVYRILARVSAADDAGRCGRWAARLHSGRWVLHHASACGRSQRTADLEPHRPSCSAIAELGAGGGALHRPAGRRDPSLPRLQQGCRR
jgi:ABC-type sugar transport system permease subunit